MSKKKKGTESKMIGNKFWERRAKHGRDKLFKDGDLLWEAATEYFNDCLKNPIQEEKLFHSQGTITKGYTNKMIPFTKTGLCLYLGCSASYFSAFKASNKESTKQSNKDYLVIIEKIEDTIFTQQFNGAASDMLNANIIARSLGLVDKKHNTIESEQPLFPDVKPNKK